MKRILWTITAVGALAVPVGMAAAQTDDDTVVDNETPTTIECDQEQYREQRRLQDGTEGHEPVQQRLRAHDCEDCEHMQLREQVGYDQGQGEMVRNQVREQLEGEPCEGCEQAREQVRVEEGQGTMEQKQLREPVEEPATEPAQERVEDGSGEEVRVGQDARQYREHDRAIAGTPAGR